MNLLPLDKLGLFVNENVLKLGLFLPWISANHGNKLYARIIHEKDQFLKDIPTCDFELSHSLDPVYGDYWSGMFSLKPEQKKHPKSAWGEKGRYLYRFMLDNPDSGRIDWIIDPFARSFGIGKMSAFNLGNTDTFEWGNIEKKWKTPHINDLIMYEMMISEFAVDFEKTTQRLEYLKDLGVNCLEIMPVSNVVATVDWGFLPLGYFGVDDRFGTEQHMKQLVREAHKNNIAVILDVVYGHTSDLFPYCYLYNRLNYHENPFMGPFAKDYFGAGTDWNRDFTRDYFFTVSHYWLDNFHIDGFRYDCVPNYWDGSMGIGYANLTYRTYKHIKKLVKKPGHWQRFSSQNSINIIQCAEQLEGPVEIIKSTYSNSTWQNETLGSVQDVAHGNDNSITNLGFRLGLPEYPVQTNHNNETIDKNVCQYIENHDHSRFICHFGTISKGDELLQEGDRSNWYKLQPYLICLFTGKGIPFLWQGQELCENYFVPHEGWGRVMLFRPVHWEYFYDDAGRSIISLIRKLTAIRNTADQFRRGEHYFYNDPARYQNFGILAFSRWNDSGFSLVAVNFTDTGQWIPFWFPISGNYREELHGEANSHLNLNNVTAYSQQWLHIPSHYGRIWTVKK